MRQWRLRLPLKVCSHKVQTSTQHTPSTSTTSKAAYTILPLQHIERVLNNPKLMSKMYFGPGIMATSKQEFCHGDIWQELPLFGECALRLDNEGK
jgi:hypothetical protein